MPCRQTDVIILRNQGISPARFVSCARRPATWPVAAKIDEQKMRSDVMPAEVMEHGKPIGILIIALHPVGLGSRAQRFLGFVEDPCDALSRVIRPGTTIRSNLTEMRLRFDEQPPQYFLGTQFPILLGQNVPCFV